MQTATIEKTHPVYQWLSIIRDGIDSSLRLSEQPIRECGNGVVISTLTPSDLERISRSKINDQIEPLKNMFNRNSPEGQKAYDFLERNIERSFSELPEAFREGGWEAYGAKLNRLKRYVGALERYISKRL